MDTFLTVFLLFSVVVGILSIVFLFGLVIAKFFATNNYKSDTDKNGQTIDLPKVKK